MKHWPFKVISEDGKPKIEVEHKSEAKRFFPEEISAMVLVKVFFLVLDRDVLFVTTGGIRCKKVLSNGKHLFKTLIENGFRRQQFDSIKFDIA